MTPVITVVVVSWEGLHLLGSCMDALENQTLPRAQYQVWLVDNGSTDGTAQVAAQRWPRVRVLRSETNLGFAGGCDLALRQVTTPYAVLVNNDAVADVGLLAALLQTAASGTGRLGAVTAKVLLAERFRAVPDGTDRAVRLADGRWAIVTDRSDLDGLDVLNSTGNEVRTDGRGQDRGWLAVDADAAFPPEVFGFCGAAALLDMSATRAAGGFDPRYFLYYEDTDLSWRLRLLGFDIAYEPRAVVWHAHAASAGEGSRLHLFHDERNRLLTLVKCAPAQSAALLLLRHLLTVASIAARETPRWSTTGTRLRSLASFMRLLPDAVAQRRRIGRTLVVERRLVSRLLVAPETRGRLRPRAERRDVR